MRYRIPLLAAMLLMPLGASAQPLIQSQEGIALQNEILQLQQQVQQMQGQGGGGGSSSLGGGSPPPPSGDAGGSLVAGLLTQVQQLQQQVQTLSGQVSELQHQVDTQHDQTEKEISDLKFQMSNGGAAAPGTAPAAAGAAPQAANAPQNLAPSAPSAPPAAATAAPGDTKTALKAALDAYGKHNYATARTLAQGIVTNNKAAPEAYRAQYLVAQSYAAQGDSQNAAVAFYGTYNMNKNGTYAPRALLGLASSLSAIHQNQEACETISSLNSQFTNLSAGMQSDVAAVSKRANCQ